MGGDGDVMSGGEKGMGDNRVGSEDCGVAMGGDNRLTFPPPTQLYRFQI